MITLGTVISCAQVKMLFSVVSVRSVVSNFSRQVKARGEVCGGL